jgi:hypothetical protein
MAFLASNELISHTMDPAHNMKKARFCSGVLLFARQPPLRTSV